MKLFPFFKPYKKFFAITLGLNILLAGVDILVPLFQSYAIDTFIIPDRLDGLGVFALVYILVIASQTVCVYLSVHAATSIEMNVGKGRSSNICRPYHFPITIPPLWDISMPG